MARCINPRAGHGASRVSETEFSLLEERNLQQPERVRSESRQGVCKPRPLKPDTNLVKQPWSVPAPDLQCPDEPAIPDEQLCYQLQLVFLHSPLHSSSEPGLAPIPVVACRKGEAKSGDQKAAEPGRARQSPAPRPRFRGACAELRARADGTQFAVTVQRRRGLSVSDIRPTPVSCGAT